MLVQAYACMPYAPCVLPSLCLCALQATEFQRMQWVVLNNAVSLTGYWAAAYFIDKRWCVAVLLCCIVLCCIMLCCIMLCSPISS